MAVHLHLVFLLDPRVEDWLLMSSPLPQTIILGFYVYFVTSLGPKLMENRKPFELKKVMITYNFSIVLFSVYMFYEASIFSIPNGRVLTWVLMFVCHDVSSYDFKGNSPRFKKFQKLSSLEQIFAPFPKNIVFYRPNIELLKGSWYSLPCR